MKSDAYPTIEVSAPRSVTAGQAVRLGEDVAFPVASVRAMMSIDDMLDAAAKDLEAAAPSVDRALALIRLAQEVRLYQASKDRKPDDAPHNGPKGKAVPRKFGGPSHE